jgi:hypothetical protein
MLLDMLAIPTIAQPKNLREGLYSANDLNLSLNSTHTIQNNSTTDYAFMMIFDSNQIAQQLMQLNPESEKYILSPLEPGYQLLIVTNGEVTIN